VLKEVNMAGSTEMIHVRVDDELKAKASKTLELMGLTVSDAVRLFLHRVVTDQALPFEVEVPNAETSAAMTEADEIVDKRRGRFDSSDEIFADLAENS
jgi:DNA-damage-inducible protein J